MSKALTLTFGFAYCPGLCFGAGLGITLFGMSYMFIHDGLVHRRFPVAPIADVPYLKRVAIAHKLHHSEKYDGVPWGLFLGPQVRLDAALPTCRKNIFGPHSAQRRTSLFTALYQLVSCSIIMRLVPYRVACQLCWLSVRSACHKSCVQAMSCVGLCIPLIVSVGVTP